MKRKLAFFSAALLVPAALAQTLPFGKSTGSDGALNLTTPGTIIFNPRTNVPPLNPAGDNIFNFTSITIGVGVTLRLEGDILNGPVVFLASGPVQIDGTIDLSGQGGFSASNTTQRTNTIPGAGGYGGGYPGVGANSAGAGLGPAGGNLLIGGCAGDTGGFTGNQFLVPLVGGSGGTGNGGSAGGAGGGAILIASPVSISGSGSINASGGSAVGGVSFAGAGGGIRLIAPNVAMTGLLNVSGGFNNYCGVVPGATGIVRVEAYQIGQLNTSGTLYTATPFGLFLNSTGTPSITVSAVNGVAVPANPTGSFTIPDVTVNSSSNVTFSIQATNVPIGTVATLTIFSENGPDLTAPSTPLAGSLASSTATASAPLPSGFSKGFVKATF